MVEGKIFCLDMMHFPPKSRDHTILRPSLDLTGLDLEGGYCYDYNTKSTPVPLVTPVMSPDLICYYGSSSQLNSSLDFLLIVFSICLDSPHLETSSCCSLVQF